MKSSDGGWISRATELFDRCNRKCGVSFPEEAKGMAHPA